MQKIVLASSNLHKLEEFRQLLGKGVIGLNQAPFSDEIEENGSSFLENALIKAKAVSLKLNAPALSDDSGLCVDALNGAPGIFSARFSGENATDETNRALLLEKLSTSPIREAHFECVVVLYFPNGKFYFGKGQTNGSILFSEEGENGFGYDSLFYSDELKKSFAEASAAEKNSVSHRARAIYDLIMKLKAENIEL